MKKIIQLMTVLVVGLTAQVPDWTLDPHDFEYSASLTGQIRQDDMILEETGGLVSAWNGETLVGAAPMEVFTVNGLTGFTMTLYSHTAAGAEINFRYYDAVKDTVLPVADVLFFESDAIWGDHFQPYVIRALTPDPSWVVNPHDFEYDMSVTAVLNYGGYESRNPMDAVAAFSGEQLLGTARPVYYAQFDRYICSIPVYSNAVGGSIRFEIYDADNAYLRQAVNQLEFEVNGIIGDFMAPYVISDMTVDPVTADFSADNTSGLKPLTVAFTDLSSGPVNEWLWDFGDGENSDLQNPVHTYMEAGIFTVSLTVSDGVTSDTETKADYITVDRIEMHPDFAADISAGPAPLTVQFTDLTPEYTEVWLWNFGDGTFSDLQYPIHTYTTPGVYTVMLTVEDMNGEPFTASKTDYITVTEGDNGDWDAPYETLYNTDEAEVVTRTGDIDNLGFGWPVGFDPFSGQSTNSHNWPFPEPDADDPAGTDTILVPTSYTGNAWDGYSSSTGSNYRNHYPVPLYLAYDLQGRTVNDILIQLFVDDFQAPSIGTVYQVTLDGTPVPFLSELINGIDQTGPIGKLVSAKVPEEFFPLFTDGLVALYIDDPVTGSGDGYAIDFVRVLFNTGTVSYTGTISGTVTNTDGEPLAPVFVSASGVSAYTDDQGNYTLNDVPAGLVRVSAYLEGYGSAVTYVDLVDGASLDVDFVLGQEITVDFAAVPLSGEVPFNVIFTDLSSGSISSWSWDFGDGGTSEEQNPEHTYTDSGYFDVTLEVTDSEGGIHSLTREAYIYAEAPFIPVEEPEGWFWQNPWPHAENLNSVRVLGDGTVVAVGNNGLVQRSFDGGLTWDFPVSPAEGENLNDVYFSSDDIGWIVGSNGLLMKSAEKGLVWTKADLPTDITLYSVYFTDVNHGWITGSPSLWDKSSAIMRTVDGGATWTAVSSEALSTQEIRDVCFIDNMNGWAVTEGDDWYSSQKPRILRTLDGGVTWTVQYEHTDYASHFYAVHFADASRGWAATYKGEVLRTTDGGTTWTATDAGIFRCYALDFATDGLHGWTAGQNGGFAYTSDGGITWTSNGQGTTITGLDLTDSGTGYMVGELGLTRMSADGGATVEDLQTVYIDRDIRDLHFFSAGRGWAVGSRYYSDQGLWVTKDGGHSWQQRDTGIPGSATMNVVAEGPGGGDFFIGGDWDIYDLEEALLIRSTDGGLTWTQISTGLQAGIYDLGFADDGSGWAVGGTYSAPAILRTADGGLTWTAQTTTHNKQLNALCVLDADRAWIAASGTRLLKTVDGGAAWTAVQGPASYGDYKLITFLDDNVGFTAASGKLYRTLDGGVNWEEVFSASGTLMDLQFVSENRGWLTGYGGVYVTDDGGSTWTPQLEGDLNMYTVCFVDETTGWVAGNRGRIMKTSTAGEVYTGIEIPGEGTASIPSQIGLRQNFPNPFNPLTTVLVDMPVPGFAGLEVYDLRGRRLTVLHEGFLPAGSHSFTLNAENWPSGIYLCRLQTDTFTAMRKMTLLK